MKKKEEIIKFLIKNNHKPFRSEQIIRAACDKGIFHINEISNLPKELRNEKYQYLSLKTIKVQLSKNKNTKKILFETKDKQFIESVLMYYNDGRTSVCLSTQIGCQMGCKFCATGKMGFKRNLNYEEIFDQLLILKKIAKDDEKTISNIVIMGMGEPFMNYEQTMEALRMITSKEYLRISPRRITISTVGLIDGIKKLSDEKEKYNLAVSLHAPTQDLRERIMPAAKSNNIDEIIEAAKYYDKKTGRRISFEYIMLQDINDSIKDANTLSKLLKGFNCHVNLIPYNSHKEEKFKASEKTKIENFKKILQKNKINATIRVAMGDKIDASCGQLANNK